MQVNLSWASVANALYYNIYRSTIAGGPYLLVAQSNPNPGLNPSAAQVVNSYQDGPGNLVNGTNYYYVVTAVTLDGEGAYSAQFTATWPGAPATVTGLTGVVS